MNYTLITDKVHNLSDPHHLLTFYPYKEENVHAFLTSQSQHTKDLSLAMPEPASRCRKLTKYMYNIVQCMVISC